ncbi:MAG TPA: glycosyltransferase, partial [Bacillota bacterium]|nr:glycosyltransferase [Bacillota bacterium]
IGICPIREGSGTRLKVLTYMAAGLGVVSTSKGSEGIHYTDGQELTIVDEPQAFADAIVTLLLDRAALHKMGQAGHQLARESYDWPVIGKELAAFYARILK